MPLPSAKSAYASEETFVCSRDDCANNSVHTTHRPGRGGTRKRVPDIAEDNTSETNKELTNPALR